MDYTNTRVKFPARHLRALSLFAAKNDIRTYLNGVCIEKAENRPGVYLIATNGHAMIIIHEPDGMLVHEGKSVIMRLPKEMISAYSRARRHSSISVIAKGNRVSLGSGFESEQDDGEFYVMPGRPWAPGTYPDWRRVLPHFDKLKPLAAAPFRAQYLGNFGSLYPGRQHADTVRLWQRESEVQGFTDSISAIIVQVIDQPNVLGIIMPVYADRPKTDVFKQMIHQQPLDVEPEGSRT